MSGKISPLSVEIAAWAFLCSGLAIGIGIETDWGNRFVWPLSPVDNVTPAAFDKPALTEAFNLPPADQYLEIAMRPLFVVTRRPAPERPPPPPQEPPKPLMQKGQFLLTGTMLVGEARFAQLLQKTGNKPHVIGQGKVINGMTVRDIQPNHVVLEQYGDSETLMLHTAKGIATKPPDPSLPPSIAPPILPPPILPR
jgi:hypothetical protein